MSRIAIGIALGIALFFSRTAATRGALLTEPVLGASEEASPEESRQADLYEQGTDALDEGQWDRAAAVFGEAARQPGERADGALYWKAYAQSKLGRRSEALATLSELSRRFPKSRWSNDAAALELELKGGRNVQPESVESEDLKLIAINSLLNTDADRAIPMLEKFLSGSQSPKLKDRALFVLAQSGSPRARQVVGDIAAGKSNPGLQEKAIQYLGLFGGEASQGILKDIYSSPSSSTAVKEQILHSYMLSGNRQRVLEAARSEKNPQLREAAVHQLGVMGAGGELWQLYQAETSADVKEALIQAMFVAGDGDHLLELVRTEKNADLRAEAIQKAGLTGRSAPLAQLYATETSSAVKESIIQALFLAGDTDRLLEIVRTEKNKELRMDAIQKAGLTGKARSGEALNALYRSEKDAEIKGAVIQAFFVQGNAHALVDIAKTEKDKELREDAVQKLSLMKNKEATDYLMEILNR